MTDPAKPVYYQDGCKMYECDPAEPDAEGGVNYTCNKEYACDEDGCGFRPANPNVDVYVKNDEANIKYTLLGMKGNSGQATPNTKGFVNSTESRSLAGKDTAYFKFTQDNFRQCRQGNVQNGTMPNPPKEAGKKLAPKLLFDGEEYSSVVTVPANKATASTVTSMTKWAEQKQGGLPVGETKMVVIFHSEKGAKAAEALKKQYEAAGIAVRTEVVGNEFYDVTGEDSKEQSLGTDLVVASLTKKAAAEFEESPRNFYNRYLGANGKTNKVDEVDFSDSDGTEI